MLEVETKYELTDKEDLLERLAATGASSGEPEQHADTYYRHPCRDFVETNEALRIRAIDSVASVTYKGPKLPVGDLALKARKEIEWCLAPGDTEGRQMEQLMLALGFTKLTTVRKERRSFLWPKEDSQHAAFTLTIDHVQQVGWFAEIELLIDEESPGEVERAGERINELAARLGLSRTVRESYLELLLQKTADVQR
jgi:adenylate cyclase class 2